jgi:hypothetical protein
MFQVLSWWETMGHDNMHHHDFKPRDVLFRLASFKPSEFVATGDAHD